MLRQVGYFLAWVEWYEADLIVYLFTRPSQWLALGRYSPYPKRLVVQSALLQGPPVDEALATGSPVASSGLEGQPHSISRAF
jgi:hypothetical protein